MIRATSKSINFKALTETQIRFRVEYTKITKKSSNGIRSKHNLRSRLNRKHEVKLINSPKITLNKETNDSIEIKYMQSENKLREREITRSERGGCLRENEENGK